MLNLRDKQLISYVGNLPELKGNILFREPSPIEFSLAHLIR